MTLNLHLKTLCLQICVALALVLSFGNLQAQCIENLELTSILVTDNSPLCSYTTEICVDVVGSPIPDHVNIEIESSLGIFNQTVNSFSFISNMACITFSLVNIPCGEIVRFSAYGYETPSFTSVCAKVTDQEPLTPESPQFVELTHFNSYIDRSNIMLEWITSTEISNDYFEVEHSTDGRIFSSIDKVDGAGNSTEAKIYRYKHNFPVNGKNYYRLKQVEFDGTISYSDIILTEFKSAGTILIFPTVVENGVSIKMFDEADENTPVSIFNATGNLMMNRTIPEGSNFLEIPTYDLQAGIYYVKINLQGTGVITKTFVKKSL